MTVMTEAKTATEAAANWWADAVRAPRYDNGGDGMAGMLMEMVAARQPDARPEQRSSFADILAPRLQERLERFADWDEADRSISLGVDYGPDPLLGDAAREAGISTQKFPWKTMMWVCASHVTVSAGYQAPTVLVWATPEWLANRPTCGTQQWDESKPYSDGYHGEPFSCSLPKYHDEVHLFDSPLALCATCGRPDSWYHREDERGHMPDFHEFVVPA